MYLIDTNVISGLRRARNANLDAWYASVDMDDLYLSVLVLGEIRIGIEQLRGRDLRQAVALEQWLARVRHNFVGRIFAVDAETADLWGRLNRARRLPVVDSLLAATAMVHNLTLVTRNVRDVADTGAKLLNPFEPLH